MRKAVVWLLILAVVAGGVGGVIWLRQRRAAEQPVGEVLRTGEVMRGDLQLAVAASGNLAVNERADLLIRAPGKITAVNVTTNSQVENGDVLVEIDTTDIARSVRQAEVALSQAELALATARETTDEEEVRLAEIALSSAAKALEVARIGKQTARVDGEAMVVQAQRQRENTFKLLQGETDGGRQEQLRTSLEDAEAQERIARLNAKLIDEQAESQWQAALARYEQAKRNLEKLQEEPDADQIRQRELQVEQAQLRLDQAKRALDDSTITAPFSGVVAASYIEAGTYQRAGSPALTLIDTAAYYVDVTIDEIDIGAIVTGQKAEVVLDAYPKAPLEGTVERIAPASTNLGGLVAYTVRLRVEGTGAIRLLDGMTASVSIRTRLVEDVVLVPNWAVRIDQEAAQAYVYRIVNGLPERTQVELGRRNDTYTELLSGLSAGDQVGLVAEERVLPMGGPFGN